MIDAVLFEGGAFAEFLQMRGSLLPDDERLLAEQWLLVDRSVFEVEQVQPGQGVTVRDVRTGDTHEVRERAASRHLKPGQLICARVVPAGDTMQFFGGLEPVALHERDALIAPARHRARRGGAGGAVEPPVRAADADQYRGRSAGDLRGDRARRRPGRIEAALDDDLRPARTTAAMVGTRCDAGHAAHPRRRWSSTVTRCGSKPTARSGWTVCWPRWRAFTRRWTCSKTPANRCRRAREAAALAKRMPMLVRGRWTRPIPGGRGPCRVHP